MKKHLSILVPVIMLLSFHCQAQEGRVPGDFEKFKSQKIAFLSEKMNLTPGEAQEFWPVYNQFEKERMEIQHLRRQLEQKTRDENLKMSDQEIIKITRDISESFKKEAAFAASYNEKYLKILPPQKVLQLYRAENQFKIHMFNQFRNRKGEE